jgi:hypothetical protein
MASAQASMAVLVAAQPDPAVPLQSDEAFEASDLALNHGSQIHHDPGQIGNSHGTKEQ